MVIVWVIVAIVVVLLLILAGIYNGLVRLRVRVDEAWSDITVQLKRRLDLIPNLVNSVQGYAAHEKTVFEDVSAARANLLNAQGQGVKETAAAENQLEGTLKSLFAVSEAYPELKANQNFLDLQAQLTDTEDKIQASRRFYNSGVRDLNTKIQSFPSNVVAGMFHFQTREFFELEGDEAAAAEKAPEVKF